MYLSQLTVNLEPDGKVRAARGEYLERDESGRTTLVGTKRIAAADLEDALPVSAALLSQIESLQSEIEDLKKERDDAIAAKATAAAATSSAEAATQAAISQAETDKAALQSQIDALTAQLNPVDASGFPVLSAVQVRLALLGAGITPAMVDAAIDRLPAGVDRDTARTYWEYAVQFSREHPFIEAFAGALGLTSEQVDVMWRAAAEIA